MSKLNIRLERREDYREVENLTREAFWNVYRPGCLEHYVLNRLRNDDCFIPELSYCIEKDGKIVAHIAYAKAEVTGDDGVSREVAIFGPVSVLPEMQKGGIRLGSHKSYARSCKRNGYTACPYYRQPGLLQPLRLCQRKQPRNILLGHGQSG